MAFEVKLVHAFLENFSRNAEPEQLTPLYILLINEGIVTAEKISELNIDNRKAFYAGYYVGIHSPSVVPISYKSTVAIGVSHPQFMPLGWARSMAHLAVEACNQFKKVYPKEVLPCKMYGFRNLYSSAVQQRFNILSIEPIHEFRVIEKEQYANHEVWQDKPDIVSIDNPFIVQF